MNKRNSETLASSAGQNASCQANFIPAKKVLGNLRQDPGSSQTGELWPGGHFPQ